MAIYNINAQSLTSIYDVNGIALSKAYNVDGVEVYSAQTPTANFRVMTYNVGHWYIGSASIVPESKDEEYYELQNGMIANTDADLLCICEYRNMFSDLGRTALSLLSQYYPYIQVINGDYNYTGRAICSKYPVTNIVANTQKYDTVELSFEGKTITVAVVHLTYSQNINDRVGELQGLINYLKTKTRFIACGDYNTLDCKSTSGADYTAMIVPLLNEGFHVANCTDFGFLETYSDQPTGTWTGCLDNIVTSSNINILSASVDTTKLTDNITDKVDHMPLIAELQIN